MQHRSKQDLSLVTLCACQPFQCLTTALLSLHHIYPRRALRAEEWRSAQMLSLLAEPNKIMNAAQVDTMPCEYLSLDIMERWIVCESCSNSLILYLIYFVSFGLTSFVCICLQLVFYWCTSSCSCQSVLTSGSTPCEAAMWWHCVVMRWSTFTPSPWPCLRQSRATASASLRLRSGTSRSCKLRKYRAPWALMRHG